MVGPKAQATGAEPFRSAHELSLFGLTEVLHALPRLLKLRKDLTEEILRRRPRAVVLIDSPDFHLPLLGRLRKGGYGGPVVMIAPPTIWAWRRGRADLLREGGALCLPLFGFEHRLFLSLAVRSAWVGHPLLETCRAPSLEPERAARRIIAFFPGSRHSEIRALMPVMAEAAAALADRGWQVRFSVAPGLSGAAREDLLSRLGGRCRHEGPAAELLATCHAAVAASGTVTVEALLQDRFTVVGYRLSPLTFFVGRRLCRLPHYAMPNVLAGEEVFPELIQSRWTKASVLKALARYDEDEVYRQNVHGLMASARERELGETGASSFWARKVLEVLER